MRWLTRAGRQDDTGGQQEAPPPIPSRSPEEQLTDALARFRADLRRIESWLYKDAKEQLKVDLERIAFATHFVKDAGLDVALPQILAEVWHWPAWMSRPDAARYVRAEQIGMTELSGESIKSDRREFKRIRFVFRDRPYQLEFEDENRHFEGLKFGSLRFFDGEDLVLGIRVTHDVDRDREYYQWTCSAVEAL